MTHLVTLTVHSWLRWIVLGTAFVTLVVAVRGMRRSRPYGPRLPAALAGLAKIQLLVGLALLLWLSPIGTAAWRGGFGAMAAEPVLLFFGLAHPVLMTIGIGLLDVGRNRARRAASPRDQHRLVARSTAGWLAVAALAVPWPGLPWGRPLARIASPVGEAAPGAPAVYTSRCASCHGGGGDADGPLAPTLSPRPRAFRDRVWQRGVRDEDLARVIREGGPSRGLSALMPAHGDLSPQAIAELVQYIRAFAEESP